MDVLVVREYSPAKAAPRSKTLKPKSSPKSKRKPNNVSSDRLVIKQEQWNPVTLPKPQPPKTEAVVDYGTKFASREDFENAASEYATSQGFKWKVEKMAVSGIRPRLWLKCRSGNSEKADSTQAADGKCQVRLRATRKEEGLWHIVASELEHNHDLPDETALSDFSADAPILRISSSNLVDLPSSKLADTRSASVPKLSMSPSKKRKRAPLYLAEAEADQDYSDTEETAAFAPGDVDHDSNMLSPVLQITPGPLTTGSGISVKMSTSPSRNTYRPRPSTSRAAPFLQTTASARKRGSFEEDRLLRVAKGLRERRQTSALSDAKPSSIGRRKSTERVESERVEQKQQRGQIHDQTGSQVGQLHWRDEPDSAENTFDTGKSENMDVFDLPRPSSSFRAFETHPDTEQTSESEAEETTGEAPDELYEEDDSGNAPSHESSSAHQGAETLLLALRDQSVINTGMTRPSSSQTPQSAVSRIRAESPIGIFTHMEESPLIASPRRNKSLSVASTSTTAEQPRSVEDQLRRFLDQRDAGLGSSKLVPILIKAGFPDIKRFLAGSWTTRKWESFVDMAVMHAENKFPDLVTEVTLYDTFQLKELVGNFINEYRARSL